jgi:hypothetical protein
MVTITQSPTCHKAMGIPADAPEPVVRIPSTTRRTPLAIAPLDTRRSGTAPGSPASALLRTIRGCPMVSRRAFVVPASARPWRAADADAVLVEAGAPPSRAVFHRVP